MYKNIEEDIIDSLTENTVTSQELREELLELVCINFVHHFTNISYRKILLYFLYILCFTVCTFVNKMEEKLRIANHAK